MFCSVTAGESDHVSKCFFSVTAGESDHVSKTMKSATSSSSSDSGSSSGDESEPLYHLRERRQTFFSYRFNEFDDLINSAIQVKTNSFRFHAFNNCVGVIHIDGECCWLSCTATHSNFLPSAGFTFII